MDRYAKTGRNGKKRGVIVERPASGGKEVEDMKRNVGKEGKEGADEEERKFLRREKDQTSHESKRRRATKKTIPSSKSAVGDKYSHRGGETGVEDEEVFGKGRWIDWPAPKQSMDAAREFIREIVREKYNVLLIPDKDADGLSAGYVLHQTLQLLGLPPSHIFVHVLSKGTNVHSDSERQAIDKFVQEERVDRVVVLDQGSRPGRIVIGFKDVEEDKDGTGLQDEKGRPGKMPLLLIDHHQSEAFPPEALVLTACNSSPIATTSLLTYLTCLPLHPQVQDRTSWAALMGVIGDLGPGIKWGTEPWPVHLAATRKKYGSKVLADAVGAINAPRRTAEYNVERAWEIFIAATEPSSIARNAWLKLCRLDVNDEIEKWARVPPRFSADGKVALLRVESAYQVHPVIATRWAGTLRKARTLKMIMCANTAFNPDPSLVSFSCRISSSLRELPDDQRPDLIDMLRTYGRSVQGFQERVGDNFARGHKEATGGIISRDDFNHLLLAMGIDESVPRGSKKDDATKSQGTKVKQIDPSMQGSKRIDQFFKVESKKM